MLRVCRGIPDKRILNLPAPTERYLVSIFRKKERKKRKKNEIKKKEKWHNKELKSIFQGILAAQPFKIRCLSLISELTILVVTCMHLLRFRTAFATFVCKISDISTRSENNFRITISIETAPVQPTQIFFFFARLLLAAEIRSKHKCNLLVSGRKHKKCLSSKCKENNLGKY